ncbi:unnamed protein product [Ilex paraguariensis]|uniref:Uncharacterized protein n=1 Tax=Ilex paraguariensis TaxID=185542 RepID=A0ABC8S3Y7_9AQUA
MENELRRGSLSCEDGGRTRLDEEEAGERREGSNRPQLLDRQPSPLSSAPPSTSQVIEKRLENLDVKFLTEIASYIEI